MFVIPGNLRSFSGESYLPAKSRWLAIELSLGLFNPPGPSGRRLRPWHGTDMSKPYKPVVASFLWQGSEFVLIEMGPTVYSRQSILTVSPEVRSDYSRLVPRRAKPCS